MRQSAHEVFSKGALLAFSLMIGLGPTLSGCHLYHTAKFARQDKVAPLAEPYMVASPPVGLQSARTLSSGALIGVHDSKGTSGQVSMVDVEGEKYIRVQNWSTVEGPDLYFYLVKEPLETLIKEPKRIAASATAIRLVANNLRPSNLGFAGEDLWLKVPPGFEDGQAVVIHCLAYTVLFSGAQLMSGQQ